MKNQAEIVVRLVLSNCVLYNKQLYNKFLMHQLSLYNYLTDLLTGYSVNEGFSITPNC